MVEMGEKKKQIDPTARLRENQIQSFLEFLRI